MYVGGELSFCAVFRNISPCEWNIHRDMVHRMSRCFTASVKYIFISIIRSISYGLVKCTGLLIDFINLLCIPNAFVYTSLWFTCGLAQLHG